MTIKMVSERVKLSAFMVQALSALAIAYLNFAVAFVNAWPSYNVVNFKSNDTVLSRPMTSYEVSLLGSLNNIGGLLATPLCGYATMKIGRKYTCILFGLPAVLSWLIVSLTNYVPLVITAMGLSGFSSAGQMVTTLYVSEIAEDSIRGSLAAANIYESFLGILFSYTIGGFCTYHQVVYTHLTMTVLYILMMSFLPDSPIFLLQTGKEKEAARSIAFYRRLNLTSKDVETEVRKIKHQLDPKIEKLLEGAGDIEAITELYCKNALRQEKISAWQFLMNSESSKRALFTVMTLISLTAFMGSVVLQVYAEPLFKEALPSMSSNLCAILLAVDFFVGCLVCASVVDKFGRKPLLALTTAVAGICWLMLASQLQFGWAPHWFTAATIYGFTFAYNMGGAAIPFIINSEVFLPEVRGLCNAIAMSCLWIMNFVTLTVFNVLSEFFGLEQVFYGFGTSSILCALYTFIFVPETKGLSVDTIQLLFVKKQSI